MKRFIVPVLAAFFCLTNSFAQSADILPADNLVVEGIPPIPSQIASEVGRYTEFRSAALFGWNPARHEMLISTRFSDVAQVHYVRFPGGARTQMTFFPDRVGNASFGPVHDDYFVFNKDIGGGEWFQNYRFDLSTGDITLLTDGKSRNTLGIWSKDGSRMAYGSTRRNGKDIDFYTVDPLNPKSDAMLAQLSEGEAWNPLDWSQDGTEILAEREVSANESYIWMFDARTGEKKLITPQKKGEEVSYQGGRFSSDGKGFYTVTDRGSEFLRLTYIDFATGKHDYITKDIPWDVDDFDITGDGKTIAFTTNEDGMSVLHLMDLATRKVLPVPKLPVGGVTGLQFHKDGTLLGFNMTSARSALDVYSLDIAQQKVDRWTFSETGGLNIEKFPEPELVRWKSFDGKMISGFLYRPPAKFSGKTPVIINIHGGPESQFRPGFLGRNNYYLNELGAAILFPNVRGSTGYGKTFLKLDNGFKREDSYRDIGALIDWIKTQPGLDGDRIMVTGGSYGGFMTFAVATTYNDKIRCSLPVVGVTNFVTFLEHTEAYRRDLRRVEYGDEREPKMRAFLEKIAPLNKAQNVTKPMFVVQGKNDPRVPYTEAEQMVSTLKKSATPVWFLLAKDEGHGFAKKKNQDYQFYATVMFMKQHLLK
ncbi:MAG TPA: prolyl oligopeptidase family serine peptidase [Bacteroidota bacterium]|jgi:dipeptidyl aminopeptidase/acylaminoacyl peptidase